MEARDGENLDDIACWVAEHDKSDEIEEPLTLEHTLKAGLQLRSPFGGYIGTRHGAPRKPLWCVDGSGADIGGDPTNL